MQLLRITTLETQKRVGMVKIIFILFAVLSLASCSTAEKSLQKFYKLGGKIEPVTKTVTIHDTIKGKDGKDSIIERLIFVDCPEPIAPKTRFEIRFDNKRFKDSLKFLKNIYNDSLSFNLKNNKLILNAYSDSLKFERDKHTSDNRNARKSKKSSVFWSFLGRYWWVFLIIGFLIRQFLPQIWKFILSKFGL